ncbi:helix-turn-helix domain-containing protein [Acetobacterium wieringae]|uniref:Helix-turn-helix domain-containing protein n=1 Tax=Acetobacterium wieringae TaxID=52694 RepID=A0ABY6HE18_9FIRM|nr:helix-turn-helix transcriptional regulator [Acetobacterium wieringae]UYO62783.1 helix-turn-helix domain-containing protein [Acetobacterium wieringae]
MITAFGKCLRRLRIDSDEILKDMAEKLNVTSSFLSAVENGKRNIPNDWIEKISILYGVTVGDLRRAAEQSAKDIKISLEDRSESDRDLVFSFARNFNQLNDDEKENLKKILSQKKR